MSSNPNPHWIETAVFNGNPVAPLYFFAGTGVAAGCSAAFSTGAVLLAGAAVLAGVAVLSDAGVAAVFCAATALSSTMEAGF